jgi:cytoplasmic iron level regulating protein YaaA (DUF328/UPF0246 family)
MQIILSPAKTLKFDNQAKVNSYSAPLMASEAKTIMGRLTEFSQKELAILMSISSNLAELNTIRHNAWEKEHTLANSKQCVYAFNGEAYNGLKC